MNNGIATPQTLFVLKTNHNKNHLSNVIKYMYVLKLSGTFYLLNCILGKLEQYKMWQIL